MAEQRYVEVVEYETFKAVRTLGPYANERLAERAQRGVDRNLDHERFFTRVSEWQPYMDKEKPDG